MKLKNIVKLVAQSHTAETDTKVQGKAMMPHNSNLPGASGGMGGQHKPLSAWPLLYTLRQMLVKTKYRVPKKGKTTVCWLGMREATETGKVTDPGKPLTLLTEERNSYLHKQKRQKPRCNTSLAFRY